MWKWQKILNHLTLPENEKGCVVENAFGQYIRAKTST